MLLQPQPIQGPCGPLKKLPLPSPPAPMLMTIPLVSEIGTHIDTTGETLSNHHRQGLQVPPLAAMAATLMTASANSVSFLSAALSSSKVACNKAHAWSYPSKRAKVRTQP
jgi:hypothetical protein